MEFELQQVKSDGVAFPAAKPISGTWVDEYREEIDSYYRVIKRLNELDPFELFRTLSAFSARLSEMKTRLHRLGNQQATSFRTREVEPLLEEVDRQFKIHSRLLTFAEMELKLSGERGLG